MKKPWLAERMAKESGVSKAEAADQLDRVVHEILIKLRKGQPAPLPGLGKFTPGDKGDVQFEAEKQKGNRQSGKK